MTTPATEAPAPTLAEQLAPPSTGNDLADEIMALPDHQPTTEDTEAVADAVIADASKGEEGSPEDALTEGNGTEAATETPAAEAAPKVDESALFSDTALSTKDGVKAAADYLKTKQKDIQTRELVVSKRTSKLRAKVQAFGAEKEQVKKERDQVATFARQLQTDVTALQRGSAKEILGTIGRLTGKDPTEVYREISILMASNGKTNGKADPEVEAVKAELAELKRAKQEEAERAQMAAQEQAIEAAKDRLFSAASAPEKFPMIARFVADEVGGKAEVREYLADWVIERYTATGQRPTDEEAAQELERKLLAVIQPAGTTGAPAAKSDQGQAPKQPSAKPNATAATKAPAQRKPTGAKMSVEELANDPSFMSALG